MRTVLSLFRAALVIVTFFLASQGVASERVSPELDLGEAILPVLTIGGVINPLSARYLKRELSLAHANGARLLVVRLNTPGGLDRSMREMVEAILNSPVPVVVFVSPPGARAASAGMFLTIAAHIAAMAPGTNIGAAHPVAIGGSEKPDKGMMAKVVNDAAALARSVASARGRNARWAETAVKESASITADEALKLKVIDIVAPDLGALLEGPDGRSVSLSSGDVILKTAGARVVERPMPLPERILDTLIDPNIAYILLSIGFIGIIAELYNPGMVFPGLTGVISLLLAFVGLGNMPVSWAGVAFIALAVALWVLELQTEGLGILAAAGLVSFILGSLILYTPLNPVSPALPRVRVNGWVIAAVALSAAGFFALIARAVWAVRKKPRLASRDLLVGARGVALTPLAPSGTVSIGGESWSAAIDDPSRPITSGEMVEVSSVEGVTLKVHRIPQLFAPTPAPEPEVQR